jgi:Holliday junction DNA helicase RuvB
MSGQNEINDAAPTSLAELVGQQSVLAQVRVALDAARQDGTKFDHALLVGPAGTGKTQTAKVIASEMKSDFREILAQSITSPADLNAVLLGATDRMIVFLDEAHELAKDHQTALYMALDQRRVFINGGRAGRPPQAIPLADFTLLLASTEEYCLLQPLRDRCRLLLRFDFMSAADLMILTRQRSRALRWPVADEVLHEIARRSRGTPRLALRLLQACRRVCRSEGASDIELAHLLRACRLEELDELGLGPMEQSYLREVASGVSRLNVIASRLGLPTRSVAEVCEPFLIRIGFLVKDDQGRRQLTAEGREHLARSRSGVV